MVEADLGLGVAVRVDLVGRDAETVGDLGDRLHLGVARDLEIARHGGLVGHRTHFGWFVTDQAVRRRRGREADLARRAAASALPAQSLNASASARMVGGTS
jgi:hypothetical protein